MGDKHPGALRDRNLLIVVEDPAVDFDTTKANAFLALPSASILPVCEGSSRAAPSAGYPTLIMYRHPPGRPEEAAPEALFIPEVGDDALAVFISYRHDDCARIAGQVFHALAEARHNVFLDRFCGTPSHDFVGLILAELFEKGILLVLETAGAPTSTWIKTEVWTAMAHHMGVFKVNLPGSKDYFPSDSKISIHLNTPTTTATSILTQAELDRIVSTFRAAYPQLSANRRNHLRNLIDTAAKMTCTDPLVQDRGRSHGLHLIQRGHNKPAGLRASARPPSPSAFHEVSLAASAAGARGVITGPLVQQLPRQGIVTNWLGQVAGVDAIDEGRLLHDLPFRI